MARHEHLRPPRDRSITFCSPREHERVNAGERSYKSLGPASPAAGHGSETHRTTRARPRARSHNGSGGGGGGCTTTAWCVSSPPRPR
ncbi:hypothetical protein OH77DRAFT_669513 [Trametes cingulata]|nr:hypothetical protein OH77DRAFT_669513 [Trametes cingulata]